MPENFILIRNLFNVYILYTLEYLHFDERIKEFSVSLYQDQCPQIVEPFFQDNSLEFANELTADLRLDYIASNQIKPEHDIKLEMGDSTSISNYFNPKTMINSNGNYDAEMYSSFYNSDYYPPKYVYSFLTNKLLTSISPFPLIFLFLIVCHMKAPYSHPRSAPAIIIVINWHPRITKRKHPN